MNLDYKRIRQKKKYAPSIRNIKVLNKIKFISFYTRIV